MQTQCSIYGQMKQLNHIQPEPLQAQKQYGLINVLEWYNLQNIGFNIIKYNR
jgi:hypothetical protein